MPLHNGLKKFTSYFKGDSFILNVFKLTQGNIISQVISVLTIPIITRIFSPEIYGEYTFYYSLVLTFSLFSSLSYNNAILLPEDEEDAINVFCLCFIVVLIFSLLVLILVFLFKNSLSNFFNIPSLSLYLWFLPLSFLFDGGLQASNYWSLRKKRFNQIALGKINESLVNRLFSLGAGISGFISSIVLIVAHIGGLVTSVSILSYFVIKHDRLQIISSINLKKVIANAKTYKKFPLVSSWSILFNNVAKQSNIYFLAYFFSSQMVGQYALSIQVLGIPMMLIGDALFRVYYKKISEIKDREEIKTLSLYLLIGMIYLIAIPICMIAVSGRELFELVFGTPWRDAGTFSKILSLQCMTIFLIRPCSALYYVINRQEVLFLFDVALLLIAPISFSFWHIFGSAFYCIFLYSVLYSVISVISMVWVWKNIGVSTGEVFKLFKQIMKIIIPFIVAIMLLKILIGANILLLLISYVILAFIYFVVLLKNIQAMEVFAKLK